MFRCCISDAAREQLPDAVARLAVAQLATSLDSSSAALRLCQPRAAQNRGEIAYAAPSSATTLAAHPT
jgi:hypothetical protein